MPPLFPVSSRFIFLFALSQFSGPYYLGAWNRLHSRRIIHLQKPSKLTNKQIDKVRRIHSKWKPFHFHIKTYYLSDANYPTDSTSLGSKGWRNGESTRLPPMWPGLKSRGRRCIWIEFVVGSLLFSERCFSGYSCFPLSSKTNISKFHFDQESGRRRTALWMCYFQIIIYLFIYLDEDSPSAVWKRPMFSLRYCFVILWL